MTTTGERLRLQGKRRERARARATLAAASVFLFLTACAIGQDGLVGASDGPTGSGHVASSDDARPYTLPREREVPAVVNVGNRTALDLSGDWAFLIDQLGTGWFDYTRGRSKGNVAADVRDVDIGPRDLKEYDFDTAPTMRIPGSWTAQVEELRWYEGIVWFRRIFDHQSEPGMRYVLQFEAVNYHAGVFLNGEPVGEHWGGFTPFAFDVTDLLAEGRNSLVVSADATRTPVGVPPTRSDWQAFGGITRPVRLVALPETHIDDAWIRLNTEDEIVIDVTMIGPDAAGQTVTARVPEVDLEQAGVTDADGALSFVFDAPDGLQKWSPESPVLYDVEITAANDTFSDAIAFRTIEVAGDQILLNGEPVFLRGISMHEEALGAFPERIATREQAEPLLRIIKDDLNGNFVRLSHYPHAEETVRLAEELGLLVWSEIPVYWEIDFENESVLELARDMLQENIRRDRNRGAVVIWSVGNETPKTPAREVFMSALLDHARALDPSRPVSMAMHGVRTRDNVARIGDPMADDVDILSVNFYEGWYGGRRADRVGAITFERPVEKPFLLTEFGAGAKAGFIDNEVRRKFSEAYQADYYEGTIAMAKNIPFLNGASPWILKDFRAPRRLHPQYQDYWNRKGVISETGERKLAFDILAEWYAEIAAQEASP